MYGGVHEISSDSMCAAQTEAAVKLSLAAAAVTSIGGCTFGTDPGVSSVTSQFGSSRRKRALKSNQTHSGLYWAERAAFPPVRLTSTRVNLCDDSLLPRGLMYVLWGRQKTLLSFFYSCCYNKCNSHSSKNKTKNNWTLTQRSHVQSDRFQVKFELLCKKIKPVKKRQLLVPRISVSTQCQFSPSDLTVS